MTETNRFTQNGWTFRYRPPEAPTNPFRLLLLLHGLTGDESVMWIFTRQLPASYAMLAPRGPVTIRSGGFGWVPGVEAPEAPGDWPNLADFTPAVDALISQVDLWLTANQLKVDTFDLMGFSQGAALAYAITLLHPDRVGRVAALAGFLPDLEGPPPPTLRGKPVYIAHGRNDPTVPVSYARQAVQRLEAAGARITCCESDAEHRLSAECLHGLNDFFLFSADEGK
jgi:phospholipase/carboxylesterase